MANQYSLTNDFSAIVETQGTLYNPSSSNIELASAADTVKGKGIIFPSGATQTFRGTLYARSMDSAATLNVSDFTDAQGGGDMPVLRFCGSVATYDDLPSDAEQGDVYNVEAADPAHGILAGDNVAWDGTAWDRMAGVYAVMTGASASAAGAAGLAPQPLQGDEGKFLRGDGAWATEATMTGATSSAAGAAGLVPAPTAGQEAHILTGGGSWELPYGFREPSTAYTVGALADGAGLASGFVLRCTTAGTTSSAALDCSSYGLGDTITDGTAVWTVEQYVVTTDGGTTVLPATNGGADLGSTSQKWGKVYANHVLTAGSLYRRRTRKAFTLSDLAAAVADGDYAARDIDVGDYFTGASGYTYIFAEDNPMKGTYTGYPIEADHAGLIVDTHETCKWNDTDDTTGGYVSSKLHSYLVNTVLPKVKTDLGGVSHLYSHKKLYSTAVGTTLYNRLGSATGASNNWAWSADQYISALTEMQVYGGTVWSSSGYDTGEADQQLDVFKRFKHTDIFGDEYPWLRDVVSASYAALANNTGGAYANSASYAYYVAGLIAFH